MVAYRAAIPVWSYLLLVWLFCCLPDPLPPLHGHSRRLWKAEITNYLNVQEPRKSSSGQRGLFAVMAAYRVAIPVWSYLLLVWLFRCLPDSGTATYRSGSVGVANLVTQFQVLCSAKIPRGVCTSYKQRSTHLLCHNGPICG